MRNFMTDRDLIKKLGNLKEIKPDSSWLKANRDSLYTQISNSGATDLSAWSSFVINLKSVLRTASAPAMALASLVVLVFASSSYTHLLLAQTKPNQSLYIAREISEKAKLTTILNTEEREQMAGKFAANNAQDIAAVLSDPQFNNEQQITELSNKFNEEIKTVQKTVAKVDKVAVQKVDTPAATTTNNSDEVFTASNEKDKTGLSVAGTEAINTVTASTVSSTTKLVEEAQNLFNEKKYKEASEVLNQLAK